MFVPDLTAMWRHGSSDTDASASLSLRVASCPSSKLIASTEHWKHGPNLLKIMRGTTMLRLCAHVVCLRFGRTSCKRTSASQIWKLLDSIGCLSSRRRNTQVHHSSLPPRMGARPCHVPLLRLLQQILFQPRVYRACHFSFCSVR